MGSRPDTVPPLPAPLDGHAEASDALFEQLYEELRRLARARLRSHPPGSTLNTTGLVHESYLRLVEPARISAVDRSHFLALAARAMRYVVLDRARARTRLKRGGVAVPLDSIQASADVRAAEVIALDEALERLRVRSPRLAEVVEYRFFGGFSYTEVAAATGRSVATVERDWIRARAWLYRDLQEDDAMSGGVDEGPGPETPIGKGSPPPP